MERDLEASEVQVGTVWFVWGKHQEVIERHDEYEGDREWLNGQLRYLPTVRLCPLDSKGKRLKPDPFFVAAWRIVKFGVPSEAFQREGVNS